MFSDIFTDIASGLGTLVPAFFKALLEGFTNIFLVTVTEGSTTTTTLSAVGEVAIAFIVIAMVYKIMPTVVGWLRLGTKKGGKKKKGRR